MWVGHHVRAFALVLALVPSAITLADQAAGEPETTFELVKGLRFRLEGGSRKQFTFTDGTVQLRSGGGWLRIPRVFSDFRLRMEFRTLEGRTEAGVAVRTWTGRGGWRGTGYMIRLSDTGAKPLQGLVEGRRRRIAAVTPAIPVWRDIGTWQKLEIVAVGDRLEATLNGQPAGVYSIEERAGHVLIDARKGVIEVRDVMVEAIARRSRRPPEAISAETLTSQGGQMPRVIKEVKPRYTREAMERRSTGTVLIEAVVLVDGSVSGAVVKGSIDPDLDETAVAAVEAWRFEPAVLEGRPVPVVVLFEMNFELR